MKKHILVFDSGLGGTTVLQEIQKLSPNHTYSYVMDNGAFPYGNKTDAFLFERIIKLFRNLIPQCYPDLIVIACNTASTLVLEKLRNEFDIPFVGVVPAIKPAATLSQTKIIGLLATEATIKRDYIKQLNIAHANHCEVIHFACQKLVTIAEDKIMGNHFDINELLSILNELLEHPLANKIDVFVLGCTHFPAVKPEIMAIWPYQAQWIDSGEAVARRVDTLCRQLPISQHACTATLYLSKDDKQNHILEIFTAYGILQSKILTIE